MNDVVLHLVVVVLDQVVEVDKKIVVADEVVIEALVVDFAEADENQVAAVAVVAVVDVDFDVVIVGVVEDVGVEGTRHVVFVELILVVDVGNF